MRDHNTPHNKSTSNNVPDPKAVRALIAAAHREDRGLWAAAFYSGLRCPELQALRVADVDLEARRITVSSSWDGDGIAAPKSGATRTVPIVELLHPYLVEAVLRTGADPGALLLPDATGDRPFSRGVVIERSRRFWAAAGLPVVTFATARRFFAVMVLGAGVTVLGLSVMLGHKSPTITIKWFWRWS